MQGAGEVLSGWKQMDLSGQENAGFTLAIITAPPSHTLGRNLFYL